MSDRSTNGTARRRIWTWGGAILVIGGLVHFWPGVREWVGSHVFPPTRILEEWARESPDGRERIECKLLDWGAGVTPKKVVVLKRVGSEESGETIYRGDYHSEVSGSWVGVNEVLIQILESGTTGPGDAVKARHVDVVGGTTIRFEFR